MKWTEAPARVAVAANNDTDGRVVFLSDTGLEQELIRDANLGAEARAAADHYPGTPAELIEQLRRELDSALQREAEALERAKEAEQRASDLVQRYVY